MICLARSSRSLPSASPTLSVVVLGEMPEIVKMIVEPLEFGEERAQHQGARRHGAAGGLLDRLAEGERMGEAADAGDPLRQHDRHAPASAPRSASPCRDA